MSKSKKAPQFDAAGAIRQQDASIQTSIDRQQAYNRPTTVDSFGNTVGWTQTGTDEKGNPIFAQSQTLGADAQTNAAGLQSLGQRYLTEAGGLLDQNGGDASAVNARAREYFDASTANTRRLQDQSRQALDGRLRAQGLVPGTEGYDTAMRGFENQASDALTSQWTQAQQQAHSLAGQDWDRSVQTLAGLSTPGLSYLGKTISGDRLAPTPVSVGTTDAMGALTTQYQGQLAQWQQDQKNQQALIGGLAGLGGSILSLPMGGGMSLGGNMFKSWFS